VRDLKGHQAVVLPMIGEYSGRIIDTAGDGIAEPWSPSKTAARWRRAFPAPGS
jgi:hypothetical protein